MADKRKIIEFLPSYLRTDALSKVFSATVDHLFQPESVEFLSGYVGNKPSWYSSTTDFYISEPTDGRKFYQLDPTIVSRSYQNNGVTNAVFYEDLVNQLAFQGSLVNNHDRLFEQEYYSWCPPIDVDKFVNYHSYYWLPNGPSTIRLLNTTDLNNDAVGNGKYSYVGDVKYENNDIGTFTADKPLVFSSGLVIIPTSDLTYDLNDKTLSIEGVGRSISLVDISNRQPSWDMRGWSSFGWDGQFSLGYQDYITINRASKDGNQWSSSNRWFHEDVIVASKTVSPDPSVLQARRPIIEFSADIRLWKYGFNNRGVVDLVDVTSEDVFGTIVGKPNWQIDNVPLQDGMRILVLNDSRVDVNNRIYVVSGQSAGSIELTIDTTGPLDGAPSNGDRVFVRFGRYQLNNTANLYYDGSAWVSTGQQKFGSTSPMFQLFDVDGNSIDDPSVYPNSSFAGSFVFGYGLDTTQPIDPYIGVGIELDQFGDFVFTDYLSTDTITYTINGKNETYNGYLFCGFNNGYDISSYSNSWNLAPSSSRQYIVNEFDVTSSVFDFTIDQTPADQEPNTLPTVFVSLYSPTGGETVLRNNIDFVVNGNVVTLNSAPLVGSRVIVKSWNPLTSAPISGHYEIPLNLSANPNNLEITSSSRSQIIKHLVEIISNQTGLLGTPLGLNNYRDTFQNTGLGLSILQHRASMLKLGLLNSSDITDITSTMGKTDPMLAMQYAQKSYTRFYNRFLKALFDISSKQGFSASSSSTVCDPYNISLWINTALSSINVGKTPNSPWANSGPEGLPGSYGLVKSTSPTYVPVTSTRLGIAPSFKPMVYIDDGYTVPQLVIQTHDGARIVMVDQQGNQLGSILYNQPMTVDPALLTNPVAAAWLQFEINLYNNLPTEYRDSESEPLFDIRTYQPGKWRKTDYTRNEILGILRGPFDKWVVSNQISYTSNTGYNLDDPFTFNYRNSLDRDGEPIPGHWQGIYRWFYDTDRPHAAPWEMLGFSQKPQWWDSQYGEAPYTNGNTAMWEDLRDGIIRQGSRAGKYAVWSRPGLMSCIPVDNQGNLLPPFMAGCVASIPSVYDAKSEWVFGDGGPVESAWIHGQDYGFVQAQLGYLMKPAKFVEYTWDSLRTKRLYNGENGDQWVYIDTNSRRSSNQFYLHRETPISLSIGSTIPNESDLPYFGSAGFQHWISEYLVSQGLNVTNYGANIFRGGDVQLAHRMAGYTNADSFKGLVDSFGQIGYNSQIIPTENINIYLYRSASIGLSVYSGVIVEQINRGWRIQGYDQINPIFTIIPSNANGARNTIVIGNQKVIEYQTGLNTTKTVPYGTVMTDRQQVYDFLVSYGRWLESQGWMFDQYNSDSNSIIDWKLSAREFLFWSQGSWSNGTFIALSPSADSVKLHKDFGHIQYVNGIVSGSYPVVDRSGSPIQPQNIDVVRDDSTITVRPNNSQGVYGLKLFRTTMEHAVFFDNTTDFNDVIYQPLYNLHQERIKIYAYRVNDWNGRVDAPGYIVTKNTNGNTWTITSNFEKTAQDFTKYFNIEQPKNYEIISGDATITKSTTLGVVDRTDISNLSKHMLSFQTRNYLQNLLLEDSTEFEFYQGFIRQKGTKATINSLLRNTSIVPVGSTFNYYEEWLLRRAAYGATSLNKIIELVLPQDNITSNPQWIRFFSATSDNHYDDVFDVVPRDPLLISPPESYGTDLFALNASYGNGTNSDVPLAGYAQLGETTWYVTNFAGLLGLYESKVSTFTPLQPRDTVWQFITDTGSWMIWILVKAISQPVSTIASGTNGEPTTIVTESAHGLISGDVCVINGISGVPLINGTYVIGNVTPTTFTIPLSTFQPGTGGNIMVYRPMRFTDVFTRDSSEPPGGWLDGDLAYVDDDGNGVWKVYRRVMEQWTSYRRQNLKVDADLLISNQLFNVSTGALISSMNYYDPAKGRIPARADAEILYKTDYDPARYTSGDSSGYAIIATEAWTSNHIGEVWWDLSAVRYIDYEQGDEEYRVQQWGKIAPGTSINVYEWIRSTIPPSDWASYVAQGTSITVDGKSFIPSGSIRTPINWTENIEYDQTGKSTKYYYFWVANSGMPPSSDVRKMTTQNIANLISNPSYDPLPWYAAISQNSMIVGKINQFLTGEKIAQRINYTSRENNNNIFGEWSLVREGDPLSQIDPSLWAKLKASLTTFDGLGNDVPDYHISYLKNLGNDIRPRQTWFRDRVAASKIFVDTFNSMISFSASPLVYDATKSSWISYFNAAEPIPSKDGNWDYRVSDLAQRDNLIGAILPGQLIFVDPVSATGNLWTIWSYQPESSPVWQLVRQQSYNTANYWSYVDWYAVGYDELTQPSNTVETIADLDALQNPITGTVVKVTNGGDGKWQLWIYDLRWVLIGQQDGSIEILPNVYTWSTDFGGFDGIAFDTAGFDLNAAIEFANMIDGINRAIYQSFGSIEMNSLFFSMINYVVSEQTQVDWIIKTSNMVFAGFNQALEQTALLAVDNTDSILQFIEEAKPYHAKVREFVTGKSSSDVSSVSVMDFDVPYAYLTAGTPDVEPIVPSDIDVATSDLRGNIYYSTYKSWYDNYLAKTENNEQSYVRQQLVRNLTTTLIFDRISTTDLTGWGKSWSNGGWSVIDRVNGGAMDRIMDYYSPTEGMLPKVIEDLIGGAVYRGTNLSALGFNVDVGWGKGPWGSLLGWDADAKIVEAYLDQIIQGGAIPHYDSAIGNGVSRVFPLLKDTVNPNNLVVWADGKLRTYAVDWIVPTYATNVYIVDGGSGYSIGDQLDVLAGNSIVPVRLMVTDTDHGSITGVKIVGNGSYSTVSSGPYQTTYPPVHPGLGSNATVGLDWACKNIEFFAPPISSQVPNIYVLYVGTTFESAPTEDSDSIYEGNRFVQPFVDDNHPEELYQMLPKDSFNMDVIMDKSGGRPLVSTRVYLTDGLKDQFDLLTLPQSNQSVMAYLNGSLLTCGLGGDYVINYDTKRMVFINPPPEGILHVMSIGFGGSSRLVKIAYVANGGTGYAINDTLTFDDSTNIIPLVLRVVGVDSHGSINLVSVDNSGLYSRIPDQPVEQLYTSGHGVGAKFNIVFANESKIYGFTGTGNTTDYFIPGATADTPGGILVNVDGALVSWSRLSNGIRLVSPPPYGSTILIATFSNQEFSTVIETVIDVVNPAILYYPIRSAGSTVPEYLSTTVRKNGALMRSPVIEEFIGNGFQREWNISTDITTVLTTNVYVDNELKVNGVDYNIIPIYNSYHVLQRTLLSFVSPQPSNALISLICNTNTTEYQLIPGGITFAPGSIASNDTVITTTYTQDVDYEFRTEDFEENVLGHYILSDKPYDLDTIQVWLDGELMIPMNDYKFVVLPPSFGWSSIAAWDTDAWNVNSPEKLMLVLHQSPADHVRTVVVTYMMGLSARPSISWRTTSNGKDSLSVVLDASGRTTILSNVYDYSSSIEIADHRAITYPRSDKFGMVYINDELISFTELQIAPSVEYPNRAFLTGLGRDRLGTSGTPRNVYNVQFYGGNGAEIYYPIESATQALAISVFVNEVLLVLETDYVFANNPIGYPAGRYAKLSRPAPVGQKNVKIVSLNQTSSYSPSHRAPSNVVDAGSNMQIPGGYVWTPEENGLQYGRSDIAKFLLEHSTGG